MLSTKAFKTRGAKGFSLLELLLVVAVGAVLILAGLGAYRLVSENNNTNQAIRQLTTLKQQTQQTFAGQANYPATANLLTTMQNTNAVPPDLAVVNLAAGTMRGALGTVTLASAGANNFTITMTDVQRSACAKLALAFTAQSSGDLEGVTIGGTAVPNPATAANIVGNAAGTCRAAQADNDIVWTFR